MRYSTYERPLTLFDILGAIFRYKWRVILVTLLMLCISAVAILLYPKKYESEAKLFVRLGRGSASLDPATMGQTISIQESRESEMNSIVDMLESRGLSERIVTKIGHERLLEKFAWAEVKLEELTDKAAVLIKEKVPALEASEPAEGEMTAEELDDRKRYELAVKELGKNLKIDSPKKSTTISVTYRARTPELAKDVVEAVIESYQDMHIAAYQSGGALDFFSEQFEQQETLVGETEDLLRDKKNANAVITVSGKQNSIQTEYTEVKRLQLETRAELQAAKARVDKLREDMTALPKEMRSETTVGIAENATDTMRSQLYQLELREKELSSKYSATHPELLKLREQLRSGKAIVDGQPTEREQSVIAMNPVRLDLENKMLVAQSDVASFTAKLEALEGIENDLIERLNSVNDLEVEAFAMQRKIDIARRNHQSYAEKLEETRINAALDREALSNVSVVAPPTVRYKHASPRRSVLALLGGMFSVLCGIAVALLSEFSANGKEMRAIREAERTRYLQEMEEEKEIRSLETKSARERIASKSAATSEGEIESELALPNKAK